jgi:hypothetical protein
MMMHLLGRKRNGNCRRKGRRWGQIKQKTKKLIVTIIR